MCRAVQAAAMTPGATVRLKIEAGTLFSTEQRDHAPAKPARPLTSHQEKTV